MIESPFSMRYRWTELSEEKFSPPLWKNRVTVINDKQSLRYANFVPAARAQLPEEAIRMRVPNDVTMNNVTIGAIQKIRDLVTLQLHGTGLDAPASAPRVPHCHAGFPLTPPACARPPACGVFAAMDGTPAQRLWPTAGATWTTLP